MHVAAVIALPVLIMLWIGMNKAHRDATGVSMPSRNAMRRIRRNARKKGLPESAAYDQWLGNKHKRT